LGNKKLRKNTKNKQDAFLLFYFFISWFGQEAFMNKDFFISLYESTVPSSSQHALSDNVVSLRQDNPSNAHDDLHDPSAMATLISEACHRLNQISNSCKFANLSLFLAMAREEALILQKQSQG
jgi:hypothetical protein